MSATGINRPGGITGIPELVQSLCIGEPLGPLQLLSIASFLDWGHEYHLYSYRKFLAPAGVTWRDANEILPASTIFTYPLGPERGSYAAFANLFRYKLLLERGGWWVDTDIVCLKPFDFPDAEMIASEATRDATKVTNAAMKLPPEHRVARHCYEFTRQCDRATLTWGATGPCLIARVVEENQAENCVQPPEVFCPVPWWRWEDLEDPNPHTCTPFITQGTHAVHLWHEMWRRAGRNQQVAPPPASYLFALFSKHRDRLRNCKRAG